MSSSAQKTSQPDVGPVDVPNKKCECPHCRGDHEAKPVAIVTSCPNCGLQHIDQKETNPDTGETIDWATRPHRQHLCVPSRGGCGYKWRPALIPTVGVEKIL